MAIGDINNPKNPPKEILEILEPYWQLMDPGLKTKLWGHRSELIDTHGFFSPEVYNYLIDYMKVDPTNPGNLLDLAYWNIKDKDFDSAAYFYKQIALFFPECAEDVNIYLDILESNQKEILSKLDDIKEPLELAFLLNKLSAGR